MTQQEYSMVEEQRSPENLSLIRALLVMVGVGLVLVLVALLLLLWPTGSFGDDRVQTIPHLLRITRNMLNEGGLNIPRRILDVAIYVVVLFGLGFVITAWRTGSRNAIMGLIGVAVLGLSYAGSMALYTGPAVGTCGFTMMLFGSVIIWASLRDTTEEQPEAPKVESPADSPPNSLDKNAEITVNSAADSQNDSQDEASQSGK